jgi:hypothetical protein
MEAARIGLIPKASAQTIGSFQRWHLDDNDDEDKNGRPTAKPMLVVTRLPPGPVCDVG